MYMLLFVLNNPDLLDNLLNAWEEAGVSGVTVLPSTGLGRIRQEEGLRDDLPLIPSLADFYHHRSDLNHTLFTVVESDDLVQRVVNATQRIVGDLDEPENGILVILPTLSVHGLTRKRKPQTKAG